MSSPTFLTWYFAAILVGAGLGAVLYVVLTPTGKPSMGEPDPCLVAYSRGGADAALSAALTALAVAREVWVDQKSAGRNGCFRANQVGGVATGSEPAVGSAAGLEAAIVKALRAETRTFRNLRTRTDIQTELTAMANRAREAGWTLEGSRRTVRAVGSAAVPAIIAVVGLVRTVASVEAGQPYGFQLGADFVAIAVTVVMAFLGRRGNRTRAGSAGVRRLRAENPHLSPASKPKLMDYRPATAALSVALFGTEVLRGSMPKVAAALGLPAKPDRKRTRGVPAGRRGADLPEFDDLFDPLDAFDPGDLGGPNPPGPTL